MSAPWQQTAVAVPEKVGRYAIVRRLGKSMTDVYLAVDTVQNRKAALKLIQSDDDVVTRLVLEAERRGAAIQKALRGLDPRVIEVYDYGDADGYFYIAMEYVEGRSLAEVLRSERAIDPVRAATIALEICEQLAKFHNWQAAVVHGDIKPSNIHLGQNGTVRLLDFGIAKTLRADRVATVHQFGSPGYCSPERLSRSQVDQQSDLWAVGATLYEMLAGMPPYQAENTRKLERLIRSLRAPRALPPACPRPLRAIVTKALAPQPSRRYASAREFQADLQAFLEHRPVAAETERSHRWNPNATLEAARVCLRRATRTIHRGSPVWRAVSAAGWFATGMALWIGGALGYQAWQSQQPPRARLAAALPAAPLPVEPVAQLYREAAEEAIRNADWSKAEVYLERAVGLLPSDPRVQGELALARGHFTLQRLDAGMYPESAREPLRLYIRDQFELAAEKLPGDPAPGAGLALLDKPQPEKPQPENPARKAQRRRRTWR